MTSPTKSLPLNCGHVHEASPFFTPEPGETVYCGECGWNTTVARPVAPAPVRRSAPKSLL